MALPRCRPWPGTSSEVGNVGTTGDQQSPAKLTSLSDSHVGEGVPATNRHHAPFVPETIQIQAHFCF